MNRSIKALILSCVASAACAVSVSSRAETSADNVLARIEALEKKNIKLENENSALRGRVNHLEASKAAKTNPSPVSSGYKAPPAVPAQARAELDDGPSAPIWRSRFEPSAAFLFLQPGGGNLHSRAAYRHTIEDSVYVANSHGGTGVGAALLGELIARCEAGPWRQMIAIIGDSGNAASIALHRRFGFEPTGTLRSVGLKFGRWVDTPFMQRALGPGDHDLPSSPS
jgi:GNAT superfamily N-acetyltransferase